MRVIFYGAWNSGESKTCLSSKLKKDITSAFAFVLMMKTLLLMLYITVLQYFLYIYRFFFGMFYVLCFFGVPPHWKCTYPVPSSLLLQRVTPVAL
jgi:hypothetical protein